MKKRYLLIMILLGILIKILFFNDSKDFKTKELSKIDSLKVQKKEREKKIDFALTGLKEMIKDKMKDPDSFKLHQRIYDEKAKGDTIGLIIEYSGTNSFGARIRETAFGNYSIKEDKVWFTDIPK